mgnify:CR=1 FL=1
MSNDVSSSFLKKFVISLIALMAIGPLSINIPTVPLTLQTFVLVVTAYWFGWPSVIAAAIYVLAGLTGLPIFSGFEANTEILQSTSAGFVIGFPVMAACISLVKRNTKRLTYLFVLFVTAHLVLILFAYLYNSLSGLSFPSLSYVFTNLTPSLLVKSALAGLVVKYVRLPNPLA